MSSFAKYVPISIVIMSAVLAGWMCGRPKPQQAMKRFQLYMTIFIIAWAVLCFRYYPRYVFLE